MGYGQSRSREKSFATFNVFVCVVKDKSICLARTKKEFEDRQGTWFPISQCRMEEDVRRGDQIDVEIADWLAEKEGWDG
jgi:hypothetical protein